MNTDIVALNQELNTFGISLHKRTIEVLIGEIKKAIADGLIRSKDNKHSIFDFIREILKLKTEREVWKRFAEADSYTVTFCDSVKFDRKDGKKANTDSPATDLFGLVYIAYMAIGEFSQQLRRSSALYFLESRKSFEGVTKSPVLESDTVTQLKSALNNFPNTLEKVWGTSGIVSKYQVKSAILRDFKEGKDYIFADGILCVNDSTFHILSISFRSLKGTDIDQLPEIINLKTREYFRYQANKKANRLIPQNSEWEQLTLWNLDSPD